MLKKTAFLCACNNLKHWQATDHGSTSQKELLILFIEKTCGNSWNILNVPYFLSVVILLHKDQGDQVRNTNNLTKYFPFIKGVKARSSHQLSSPSSSAWYFNGPMYNLWKLPARHLHSIPHWWRSVQLTMPAGSHRDSRAIIDYEVGTYLLLMMPSL